MRYRSRRIGDVKSHVRHNRPNDVLPQVKRVVPNLRDERISVLAIRGFKFDVAAGIIGAKGFSFFLQGDEIGWLGR